MVEADWRSTANILIEAGQIDGVPDLKNVFTNDFLSDDM